jgi:hypothetical protein
MTDHLLDVEDRPAAPELGALNVCETQCGRCLLGPRPHLPRRAGRQKCRDALRAGSHFSCHEFANVMCRGFFDAYGDRLWYVRWAKRVGRVVFVKGATP